GTPLIGLTPVKVTFTDTSTGYITNRLWNFGDGTSTNTSALTVMHTFTTGGNKTISLTVSGPTGSNTSTRNNYIVATDQLVITAINVSGANVLISFTSQAGNYYRVEYKDSLTATVWRTAADFLLGTGNIVQAVDLGGAGRPSRFYRVKLLTNADLVPAASFSAAPLFGQTPLRVTFTDSSTGYITNRVWNFGDGTTMNTT